MQGKKGQVNVSTSLNVRSGAATKYSIVAKLKNKEVVDLLEKSRYEYKLLEWCYKLKIIKERLILLVKRNDKWDMT